MHGPLFHERSTFVKEVGAPVTEASISRDPGPPAASLEALEWLDRNTSDRAGRVLREVAMARARIADL